MVYKYAKFIQSRLLPPVCLLCAAAGQPPDRDLCGGCQRELPGNTRPCPLCAAPLETGVSAICGQCSQRRPAFDTAFVPFLYRPPMDHLIRQLKFGGRLSHARLLGDLLAESLAAGARPLPDYLIPVPLHRRRLAERGFNQSSELARRVGRRLGLPVRTDICVRVRNTPAQSGLNQPGRAANIKGAFALTGALAPETRVAILDDVMTSGNTVNEISRLLTAAGSCRTDVWCLARA